MKLLKKIAGWFYRIKTEPNGRKRVRVLFFVFKYWPNKKVRALLDKEQECRDLQQIIQAKEQEAGSLNETIQRLNPSWQNERRILEALEKYKFVPPYLPKGTKKAGVPDNCIWQLWWQGEENMPDIVRLCMDSVRCQNPDRPIIVLTKDNVGEYITIPAFIMEKHAGGIIDTTKLSNIIRLYLLAEYGGTWVDSTIYMSGLMPKEISESDFFMYINNSWYPLGKVPERCEILFELQDKKNNPYVPFSNWFIHARKGNRLICKILAMHLAYWKEHNSCIDYFIFHYLGTWALYGDEECRRIFNASPWKSQVPAYAYLQPRLFSDTSDEMLEEIERLSPIHKLTYKYGALASSVTYSYAESPHPTPGNVFGAIYRSWHDRKPLHENTDFYKHHPLTDAEYNARWERNTRLENALKERIKQGKKIRVTFLVAMTSMFPARPLMNQMLQDERYEVHLVVIPELRFGEERTKQLLASTQKELEQYRDIMQVAPINPYEDRIRLRDFSDIVFVPTPYDISTQWYDYGSLIHQELLVCIVNYGFYRSSNYDRMLINSNVYQSFWKVFVETEYNMREYANYCERARGKNTLLSGYCKMDAYHAYAQKERGSKKKTVLIAPHHSVEGGFNDVLALSNFMRYADYFLTLPEQYPDINFIFRPHPALFPVLERETHWGKEKAAEYEETMKALPNVRWSDSGNYFEDFAESDAIIQDCGSFLVDYFYTGKPQCYMLHSENDIEEKFAPLGQKCLSHCYIAYEESDIQSFMQEVVINGNDSKKEARQTFAKEEIMLNYPHASAKAADLLYESLT